MNDHLTALSSYLVLLRASECGRHTLAQRAQALVCGHQLSGWLNAADRRV